MISTYPPAAAACMAVFPLAFNSCWFGSTPSTAKRRHNKCSQGNRYQLLGTSAQRSNVVRSSRQNFRLAKSQISEIFAFKPKVKTVTEKLSFVLRTWPGNWLMVILRDSQLVIFSQYYFNNIFLQSIAGVFSANSCNGNRKWRWIFAFDRCVGDILPPKIDWAHSVRSLSC